MSYFIQNKSISFKDFKRWGMIVFVFVLFFIMVAMGHFVDQKVRRLAEINTEVKSLKKQFLEYQSKYIRLTKFSEVLKRMEVYGLYFSEKPPEVISLKDVY